MSRSRRVRVARRVHARGRRVPHRVARSRPPTSRFAAGAVADRDPAAARRWLRGRGLPRLRDRGAACDRRACADRIVLEHQRGARRARRAGVRWARASDPARRARRLRGGDRGERGARRRGAAAKTIVLSAGPLGLEPAAFDAAGDGSPVDLTATFDDDCDLLVFTDVLWGMLAGVTSAVTRPPTPRRVVRGAAGRRRLGLRRRPHRDGLRRRHHRPRRPGADRDGRDGRRPRRRRRAATGGPAAGARRRVARLRHRVESEHRDHRRARYRGRRLRRHDVLLARHGRTGARRHPVHRPGRMDPIATAVRRPHREPVRLRRVEHAHHVAVGARTAARVAPGGDRDASNVCGHATAVRRRDAGDAHHRRHTAVHGMIRRAARPRRRRRAGRIATAGAGLAAVETPVAHATATAVVVVDTGSSGALVVVDVGGGTSGIEALRRPQRSRRSATAASAWRCAGSTVSATRLTDRASSGRAGRTGRTGVRPAARRRGAVRAAAPARPPCRAAMSRAGVTAPAQPRASASYCDHVGCASRAAAPAARTGPGTAPAPSPAPAPAAAAVGSPTVSGGTTPATGSSGADSGTKAGAAASAPDRGAAEDGGQDERDGSAARATQGDAPSTSAASNAPGGASTVTPRPRSPRRAATTGTAAPIGVAVRERAAGRRGGGGGGGGPAAQLRRARSSQLGPRRSALGARPRGHANSITRLPFGDADAHSTFGAGNREPRCQRLLRASAAQGVRRRDRQPVLGGRPLIVGDARDMRDVDDNSTRSS